MRREEVEMTEEELGRGGWGVEGGQVQRLTSGCKMSPSSDCFFPQLPTIFTRNEYFF